MNTFSDLEVGVVLPDIRPSDGMLASLVNYTCNNPNIQYGHHGLFNLNGQKWWAVRITKNSDSIYRGILYVSTINQAVLIHQVPNTFSAWKQDVFNADPSGLSTLEKLACNFTRTCVSWLIDQKREVNRVYNFCISGYGFGAYLADLSGMWCYRIFNYSTVSIVTFENPGARRKFKAHYPDLTEQELRSWDMTTYLLYPNFMNSIDDKIGTIYHVRPQTVSYSQKFLSKVTAPLSIFLNSILPEKWQFPSPFALIEDNATYHDESMQEIINALSSGTNPCQRMEKWPINYEQINEFVNEYILESGQYTEPNLSVAKEIARGFADCCQMGYKVCGDKRSRAKLQCLELRHFHPDLRIYLKWFFNTYNTAFKNESVRESIRQEWERKGIPGALIQCLTSFEIQEIQNEEILFLTSKLIIIQEKGSLELSAVDFRYFVSCGLSELTVEQQKCLRLPNQSLIDYLDMDLVVIDNVEAKSITLLNPSQCFSNQGDFLQFLEKATQENIRLVASIVRDSSVEGDIRIENCIQEIIKNDGMGVSNMENDSAVTEFLKESRLTDVEITIAKNNKVGGSLNIFNFQSDEKKMLSNISKLIGKIGKNYSSTGDVLNSDNSNYSYFRVYLEKEELLKIKEAAEIYEKVASNYHNSFVLGVPKVTAANWIIRSSLIDQICDGIGKEQALAISGIAGAGKTQLAHYIVNEKLVPLFREKAIKAVCWEFVLDQDKSLEEQIKQLIDKLQLKHLDEKRIESLDLDNLFRVFIEGMDIEYVNYSLVLLFDNVDKEKHEKSVKSILDKYDHWLFKFRKSIVIITTQTENFFGEGREEINLNEGLTFYEALKLMKRKDYIKYCRSFNFDLVIKSRHKERVDQLKRELRAIKEQSNKILTPERVQAEKIISAIELIELFDGLPLGLTYAYLCIKNGDSIEDLIKSIKRENKETVSFIDDFCDEFVQGYYKKSNGATSQISAIRLMISRLDEKEAFHKSEIYGIKPSEVIQILSFFSNRNIPDLFIKKISDSQDGYFVKRIIPLLSKASLIIERSNISFYTSSKSHSGLKESQVTLITIHSQTQFAARSMVQNYQNVVNKCLNIIDYYNEMKELNDSNNLEIKKTIGSHFFYLLNRIYDIPSDFDYQLMKQRSKFVLRYIETNYKGEAVISLLKSIKEKNFKDYLFLCIKLYENIINCYAESKDFDKMRDKISKAISFYNKEKISMKKYNLDEKISILSSMVKIYLHSSDLQEAMSLMESFKKKIEKSNKVKQGYKNVQYIQYIQAIADVSMQLKKYDVLKKIFKKAVFFPDNMAIEEIFFKFKQLIFSLDRFFLVSGSTLDFTIMNSLVLPCSNISYQRSLMMDIKIAEVIVLIKLEKYKEAREVMESSLFENTGGKFHVQICYLSFLVYILWYQVSAKEKNMENSEQLKINISQWLDIVINEKIVTPREFHLLKACAFYILRKYQEADRSITRYFKTKNRYNIITEFNSELARRALYFFSHPIIYVMEDNLDKIIFPKEIYSRILKALEKYDYACKELILHLDYLLKIECSENNLFTAVFLELLALYKNIHQCKLRKQSISLNEICNIFLNVASKVPQEFRCSLYYEVCAESMQNITLNLSTNYEFVQYMKDTTEYYKKSISLNRQEINILRFSPYIRLSQLYIQTNSCLEAKNVLDSLSIDAIKDAVETDRKLIVNEYHNIAKLFKDQHSLDEAESCFRKIEKLEEDSIKILPELIELLFEKKEFREAIVLLEKLMEKCDKSEESIYRQKLLISLDSLMNNSNDTLDKITCLKKAYNVCINSDAQIAYCFKLLNLCIEKYDLEVNKNIYSRYRAKLLMLIQGKNCEKEKFIAWSNIFLQYAQSFFSKACYLEAKSNADQALELNKTNIDVRLLLCKYYTFNTETSIANLYSAIAQLDYLDQLDYLCRGQKKPLDDISTSYLEIAIQLEKLDKDNDISTDHCFKDNILHCYDQAVLISPENEMANRARNAYYAKINGEKQLVERCRTEFYSSYNISSESINIESRSYKNYVSALEKFIKSAIDSKDIINYFEELNWLVRDMGEDNYFRLSKLYYQAKLYEKANSIISDKLSNNHSLEVVILNSLCNLRLGYYVKVASLCSQFTNTKNELNTHVLNYFKGLAHLMSATNSFFSLNDENKLDFIGTAETYFSSIINSLNTSESELKIKNYIEPFSLYHCKFYRVYAFYLKILFLSSDPSKSKDGIFTDKEQIREALKDLDSLECLSAELSVKTGVVNEWEKEQIRELNCNIRQLKFYLINILEYIENEAKLCQDILLAKNFIVRLREVVNQYQPISKRPSILTKRFLSLFMEYFENSCKSNKFRLDDIFSTDKLAKCRLFVKWYIEAQTQVNSTGKLLNLLRCKFDPSEINFCNMIADEQFLTEVVNKYFSSCEGFTMTIFLWEKSEQIPKFIEMFFEIKFSVLEKDKKEYYENLLKPENYSSLDEKLLNLITEHLSKKNLEENDFYYVSDRLEDDVNYSDLIEEISEDEAFHLV